MERAAFGHLLERCRSAHLASISDARRVLVLGDGDGRATLELLRAAPLAVLDSFDLSAGMLELARKRVTATGFAERVRFHHADVLAASLEPEVYDVITAHFFLDCLSAPQLRTLVERVRGAAKPQATWIISEFQDSRGVSGWLIRLMYWFFRMTTGLTVNRVVNYAPELSRAGWRRERAMAFDWSCGGLKLCRELVVAERWVSASNGSGSSEE
jgi:ubiquinone/menaquinone biosynthesis C-methylase UbiE